jgi:hypothetical protein
MDYNIGFQEKRHFFRRKSGKIAENFVITTSTPVLQHWFPRATVALINKVFF